MLRTKLATSYIKRTFRPLYGWSQMTPQSVFLDPAWDRSVPIWPGMVLARTSGEQVTLYGSDMEPYGFCGHYVGGDGVDEPMEVEMNAVAAWVMGPDAQAEILAPAFDTDATWTDPGDGSEALVYAVASGTKRGKLTSSATNNGHPVARLFKVNSPTKITIGGLRAGVYA